MSSFPPPPPPGGPDDSTVRRPSPPPSLPPLPGQPSLPGAPSGQQPTPAYLQPTVISPPPTVGEPASPQTDSEPEPEPEGGRRGALVAVTVIVVAALIGGGVGLLLARGGDKTSSPSDTTLVADTATPSTSASATTQAPVTTEAPTTSEATTTTAEATTVPPDTTPPTTLPDLAALPANVSGVFTGPGSPQIVAEQLPSGPTAAEITPSVLVAQQVADLLAAGDYAGAQPLLANETVDPAAFDAIFGPIERLSMIALDARPNPGGGYFLLMAGISNDVGAQTTIRCFDWFSNGVVIDRVGNAGPIVDGPYPLQFSPEQVRNDAGLLASITQKCTWPG